MFLQVKVPPEDSRVLRFLWTIQMNPLRCMSMENPLYKDKICDHDHLTGKYRGAAQNKCNLNCKQKISNFVPKLSTTFIGKIVI